MAAKKRSNAALQRKRSRPSGAGDLDDDDDDYDDTSEKPQRPPSQSKNRKSQRVSPNAHRQLIFGGSVLVVAVLASLVYNHWWDTTDPRVRAFWREICGQARCARFVIPTRRTLEAARPIRPGEIIAEIPRDHLLWDLDALRSDWVQTQNLLQARHDRTQNPLSTGAFLAAYLAHLQFELVPMENGTSANTTTTTTTTPMDPIRQAYLNLLPTADELSGHPLFWSDPELIEALGPHSLTFGVVMAYHDMVQSEYDAFERVSDGAFGDTAIDLDRYRLARTHVLTRSFSPGPVGADELGDDERARYQEALGVDFTKGCHALVPILDLLNHHPQPNVAYTYSQEKRAFVISAKTTIPPNYEIYDSYGKFSDSHLFAKFGFVNGDGSGHTQASIALFHRLLDDQLGGEFSHMPRTDDDSSSTALGKIQEVQRKDLRRYLQYDDGHQECIPGPKQADPDVWALKQVKLEHLVQMANDASRWVVTVPPRNPHSRPAQSSDTSITDFPPEHDVRTLRINLMPLLETCRLMSLINSDYEGRALAVLEENLGNHDFRVEPGNRALEYRSFMCIARLSSTTLMQYQGRTVQDESKEVERLNREAFGSRNWTLAHLRLGEMQSLQILSGAAFGQLRQWEEDIPKPVPPEFTVREQSCPK